MCLPSLCRSPSGSLGGSSTENQSSPLKRTSLLLALACLIVIVLSGCENPLTGIFSRQPEVHIPAGKCAEVRRPIKVAVWTHDKDGKPIKGYYMAYAGSNVGPGVPTSEIK